MPTQDREAGSLFRENKVSEHKQSPRRADLAHAVHACDESLALQNALVAIKQNASAVVEHGQEVRQL